MASDNPFVSNPFPLNPALNDAPDPQTILVTAGVKKAADRYGLKTEQSLLDAMTIDPLAVQVGSNLTQKIISGQATSLPELQACEADKACTAGMVEGVREERINRIFQTGRFAKPLTP
jgi:hypothetical protein